MEKAYDVKVLVDRLKGRGLDVAEDLAKIVLDEVITFVADSAKLSENPYDDLVASILPLVKSEVLKQIDKIDGEVG